MATRIFDRTRKSGSLVGEIKGDPAEFNSDGVASVTSANEFIAAFSGVQLLGNVGLYDDVATAGNASLVVTVPAGKYWRLLSAVMRITADATAANRIGVSLSRDSADTTIKTITQPVAVTANQDLVRTFGYGADTNSVGVLATAAQGTLTIAEPVTDTDPFVINGVTFTCVAALTGAANEIFIGASEAATKLAFNAAFVDRDNGGVLHSVTDAVYTSLGVTAIDFATDDMVFTAVAKGQEGNAIATTETFTHASNVFDAATLGTTTAGVSSADEGADVDFPTLGALLLPAEDVVYSVTNGVAGDNFEVYLSYIEYDDDPR